MRLVELASPIDFAGWRAAARMLRREGTPPEAVRWSIAEPDRLPMPADPPTPRVGAAPFTVPPRFLRLAADVVCHRAPHRFELLYRLLWRLEREPALMSLSTDPDVAQAQIMAKAVSRASHKMTAFVRFRLVGETEGALETYVAWFEPPHRVVERTAGFFRDRFATMRFSILTPDTCCHWDGEALSFTPGVGRPEIGEDEIEAVWLTYYRSIFNPARLKTAAMQSEMPKRYWRNLPEAALIPELVAEAETTAQSMVASEPTEPRRRLPASPALAGVAEPESGGVLVDLARACRVKGPPPRL
jgi:DNA polymerase